MFDPTTTCNGFRVLSHVHAIFVDPSRIARITAALLGRYILWPRGNHPARYRPSRIRPDPSAIGAALVKSVNRSRMAGEDTGSLDRDANRPFPDVPRIGLLDIRTVGSDTDARVTAVANSHFAGAGRQAPAASLHGGWRSCTLQCCRWAPASCSMAAPGRHT